MSGIIQMTDINLNPKEIKELIEPQKFSSNKEKYINNFKENNIK